MVSFDRETVLLPSVLAFILVCCCFVVDSRADCGIPVNTIVVDRQPGQGNYVTIQEAVNSIPSGNSQWIIIQLNPGKYEERVNITSDKPCIVLQGYDRYNTSIEWNQGTTENPFDTAGFTSNAENFVAKNITFKNTYNLGVQELPIAKAVAAAIIGDKSSFYDCSFISVQDTLADQSGRHYFRNCHIEGAMDFIFGNGRSIYEDCEILVQPYPDPVNIVKSVITAQERANEEQTTGFVFKFGKINGVQNPPTWLGRALTSFSTVLFKNMSFSSDGLVNITSERWDNMGLSVTGIVYAEANNTGSGADIRSDAVTSEKNLSVEQWNYYTDISFIDQDHWLGQQP
ncbi:hypothetical protein C5167_047851 [Papaver somniferum]|uniref:pectinesterase n=1 Tax=Papaver somniferum TaxID=3469 RepID=A0A4Y7LLI7_PAPSO|nr:probable pectinesterase 15 [Papaver somniferum]RZC85061.1 hypothetical protein C5167_047851 [Papaver somniferum]